MKTIRDYEVIEQNGFWKLAEGTRNGMPHYTVDFNNTTGYFEGYDKQEATEYYKNAVVVGDPNKL